MNKFIYTNDLINDTIWNNMKKKYGENGKNPNLEKCLIYSKKKKIYSQNGEEGILEYIFQKIGFTNKYCVEFGAGNGKTISNTLYFKEKYNFKRILIEGNIKDIKNKRIKENIIHAIITSDNINELIKDIPNNQYDLLSIDIDGDDYWVWKAMKKKARVVILEYHCGIPNNQAIVCIENKGDVKSHIAGLNGGWKIRNKSKSWNNKKIANGFYLNGYYGANLKAFYKLAKEKGYEFVTTIVDNAIFVLKEEFTKLKINTINENQCIENYFNPHKYWGETHRDMYNRKWSILD